MNGQIIFANLLARPVRTFVSILAVALEVIMILMIIGLTQGLTNDTGRRVEGVGADIMLQPPNASIFVALSGSAMLVKLADPVAKIEGVKAVAPVLVQVNTKHGIEMIDGIDPGSFDAVSGGFSFIKGRIFSAPNEVIVDDVYAASSKPPVNVGDSIGLLEQTFKVTGIVQSGKGARVYMALQELQNIQGAVGHASFFFIKLNNSNQIDEVSARILATPGFEGYQPRNAREYASLMTSANIPYLNDVLAAIVFIAICVGVLVIFLSMYNTITERTREIGILRSLGASKSFIVVLVMQESFVICLMGIVVGIAGGQIIKDVAQAVFPTLPVLITNSWRVYAALFAIFSGVVGAIYPSFKAATKDPIEALAYE